MERYFQRKSLNPPSNNPSSSNPPSNNPASSNPPSNNPVSSNQPSNNPPTSHPPLNNSGSPKRSEVTELDEVLANLPAYPGLKPPMTYYNPNFQEQIRRAYLQRGKAGSDVFTEKGFKNWRKGPENFRDHVGQVGSLHKLHNIGNYVELLQFLANHDEKVRVVVFENAPGNLKYIAPNIQKELVNSCAAETIDAIISDMDDAFFSILVDESRDVSIREQMAVVLRYVNKKGQVIERFVGVQYVSDTTSSKLKEAIEQLISSTNLSMSRLREQGYDGASNMRGELNGLKTQILREYPQAYYVHCFAHQLQLALVAVAKGNENIATFFTTASSVVNIIGASCKRRDALREQQQKDIMKALEMGRGLNQEITLKRPCDTRWNSHYDTLLSINTMFHPVVKVLEWIVDDVNQDNLGEANRLLKEIRTFDFVFHLYLMRFMLGITNNLSKALQRKIKIL
ncbi:unnamed protein product [Prunus armeniaca]